MICDTNTVLSSFYEKGLKLEFLVIKFTFRCNNNCSICVENSSDDKRDLLSLDLIEKSFKETSDLDLNCVLQGGEVMLYPEYCKEIYDMWRKINKYKKTFLMTNGFWGKDQKLINFVKEELKPDLLIVTTDKWHQVNIPVSIINNIIKQFQDDKYIKLMIMQIFSNNYPLFSDNYFKLGIEYNGKEKLNIYGCPLNFFGRGINAEKDGDFPFIKDYYNEKITCSNFGISIHPDGKIYSHCTSESNGCYFGNINNTDLNLLFKKLRRPSILYTGKTYSFSDICKKLKINPLDEKWEKNVKRNSLI
jgi:MoaA/NifB/PqqE/SkfB family radical SAM enzyme